MDDIELYIGALISVVFVYDMWGLIAAAALSFVIWQVFKRI